MIKYLFLLCVTASCATTSTVETKPLCNPPDLVVLPPNSPEWLTDFAFDTVAFWNLKAEHKLFLYHGKGKVSPSKNFLLLSTGSEKWEPSMMGKFKWEVSGNCLVGGIIRVRPRVSKHKQVYLQNMFFYEFGNALGPAVKSIPQKSYWSVKDDLTEARWPLTIISQIQRR